MLNKQCVHPQIYSTPYPFKTKLCIQDYLSNIQIMKADVDDYLTKNMKVPHCELVANWIKIDQKLEPLQHTVDILGTTEEEEYFTISIYPGNE